MNDVVCYDFNLCFFCSQFVISPQMKNIKPGAGISFFQKYVSLKLSAVTGTVRN